MVSAEPAAPVQDALTAALDAHDGIERARELHRQRVVEFIHQAREARWTWPQIGLALRVSDTGARRFYIRNRGKLVN